MRIFLIPVATVLSVFLLSSFDKKSNDNVHNLDIVKISDISLAEASGTFLFKSSVKVNTSTTEKDVSETETVDLAETKVASGIFGAQDNKTLNDILLQYN